MSLLLIVCTVALVVAAYRRVTGRAQLAIRSWAETYGYRVASTRFVTAFSEQFQDSGRTAEVVYRVDLTSSSGETVSAWFLLWDVVLGTPTVVVRWER